MLNKLLNIIRKQINIKYIDIIPASYLRGRTPTIQSDLEREFFEKST